MEWEVQIDISPSERNKSPVCVKVHSHHQSSVDKGSCEKPWHSTLPHCFQKVTNKCWQGCGKLRLAHHRDQCRLTLTLENGSNLRSTQLCEQFPLLFVYLSKKMKRDPHKTLCLDAHGSLIHDSPQSVGTQVSSPDGCYTWAVLENNILGERTQA